MKGETMTHQEQETYRLKLSTILGDDYPTQDKRLSLQELAKQVGASRYSWARMGGEGEATESQLVDNIQRAIETASMVEMCRTSATMCEVASRNYKIALGAAIVAALSAIAAWIAVLN